MEWVTLACGALFTILIVISDVREYKIKNRLILPFLFLGLILNALNGGLKGLQNSVFGLLVPLCLLPLFALKMIGAGDIKAFCALGCLVGWKWSINIVLYSFIAAGILAVGFMIVRKNAAARFRTLYRYMKLCVYNKKLLPYEEFSDSNSRFRFAFGIMGGYAFMMLHYLV